MCQEDAMTSSEGFAFESVVIGNSPEAVEYAFSNDLPIVFNKSKLHSFLEVMDPPAYEEMHRRLFELGLAGLLIYFKGLQKIRDYGDRLVIIADSAVRREVAYSRVTVFDMDCVESDSLSVGSSSFYRVFDLYSVRHIPADLSTFSLDGTLVVPYISGRVDGNRTPKDLLCMTRLAKDDLYRFEYSDTANRFKIEKHLLSRHKVRSKLETLSRDVFPICEYTIVESDNFVDGRKI